MKILKEEFLPVAEECGNCERTLHDEELGYKRCAAYLNPSYWWTGGRHCPLVSSGILSVADIVKIAVKEGLIKKEGTAFIFSGQRILGGMGAVIGLFKRNKNFLSDVKRQLGITTGSEEEQGKVRVGQQKQKKIR